VKSLVNPIVKVQINQSFTMQKYLLLPLVLYARLTFSTSIMKGHDYYSEISKNGFAKCQLRYFDILEALWQ